MARLVVMTYETNKSPNKMQEVLGRIRFQNDVEEWKKGRRRLKTEITDTGLIAYLDFNTDLDAIEFKLRYL